MSKTLTYDPRSNEVMDTMNDARFGEYGPANKGGVDHLGRPCKMKTVASTPPPLVVK